jgi:hypothetical protein
MMNKLPEDWENRLQMVAREMRYPATPDIAQAVRARIATVPKGAARSSPQPARLRLALISAALILIVLAGLMSVPRVRAAVLEFLQIGGIRILIPSATQTPTPALTPLPTRTLLPTPTPGDLIALDDLMGETTLAEAMETASFELRLPTYPENLGKPDRVFIQDMDGDMLILVWIEEENPNKARLILYQIAPESWAGTKGEPRVIERTQVNGQPAVWVEGPHPFTLSDGNQDFRRLIVGQALIWEENQVTYRLESYLSLDESIKIAESLELMP